MQATLAGGPSDPVSVASISPTQSQATYSGPIQHDATWASPAMPAGLDTGGDTWTSPQSGAIDTHQATVTQVQIGSGDQHIAQWTFSAGCDVTAVDGSGLWATTNTGTAQPASVDILSTTTLNAHYGEDITSPATWSCPTEPGGLATGTTEWNSPQSGPIQGA